MPSPLKNPHTIAKIDQWMLSEFERYLADAAMREFRRQIAKDVAKPQSTSTV